MKRSHPKPRAIALAAPRPEIPPAWVLAAAAWVLALAAIAGAWARAPR